MKEIEKSSLRHAKDWLDYQRSPQAKADLAADKAKRDELTLKQGHSLKCGLLKCHPECPTQKGK